MKKLLKGLGLLAGAAAVVAGGKLIYDAYNENEAVDIVEEAAEEIGTVVDETTTEDTVEDEPAV